jgi:uroporphyrinogen decarboxylase
MKEVFARPTDKFKLAYIGGWIFDNARYLRKMEVYFLDMAMYPDELKRLHSKVADVYEAKIRGAGSAGADGIMIGEDMGTQNGLLFSPDMFRAFFKDEYKRLLDIAHGFGMKVLMHSCGMNWEIIDDLIDCGIDCFQFDQPALYDMPALAAKFRERKVALWSPTDIQKVLPTGDRELIESETRRMLDTFEGGLITKNYPDLHGIGVDPEWDMWAYNVVAESAGVPSV